MIFLEITSFALMTLSTSGLLGKTIVGPKSVSSAIEVLFLIKGDFIIAPKLEALFTK
jgi:hypothetical protein